MLRIEIVIAESFNDDTQEFITEDSKELHLEHSLVSLSKWESKWEKPFLGNKDVTSDELLDYIKCMTLNDVDDDIYNELTQKNVDDIAEYIQGSHTATTISGSGGKKKNSREVVTSELIYYWMVAHRIPFECQYWQLNRLMTLVQICNVQNQPEKKMSKRELLERNKTLNAERRAKYNTKG